MRIRVLVSLILLPLLFFMLYFAPGWALTSGIAVISVLAVQELLGATRYIVKKRMLILAMLFTACVPFGVHFDLLSLNVAAIYAVLFLFVVLLFVVGFLDHEKVTFEMIGATFMVALIVPLFLSSIIRIADADDPLSRYVSIIPFICAFGCDTCAYFVGRTWGKHKLAPNISPKKTLEGAAGGILGVLVLIIIYGLIMQFGFNMRVNYPLLALYALAGSVAAQLGDLSMSFVKREFRLKDFGSILPGHGGIMDRFDSLLFAAPAMECLMILLPAVSFI